MEQQQPLQSFHLQMRSDLSGLTNILEWFKTITNNQLAPDCLMECQIMLAEGFTNAVRHAHKHYPPQTLIKLEVKFYPQFLEILIWDWGKPFDLNAQLQLMLQQKSPQSVMELPEGGRGLQLIHAFTDYFQYIHLEEQQQNCLILRKRIEQEALTAEPKLLS